MASTPNHAVQGALVTYLLLKPVALLVHELLPVLWFALSPVADVLVAVLLTLGAVLGAAPDLIGWVGRRLDPGDWQMYAEAHHGTLAAQWRGWPQYGLHLYIDTLFHRRPGNWWPRLWYLELLLWVLNGAVVYLALNTRALWLFN